MNRRRFLYTAGGAAAFLASPRRAFPFSQSPAGIPKFKVPLTGLGGNGIEVLTPDTKKYPGTDYYEIVAQEFQAQILPNPPNPKKSFYETRLWGYTGATSPRQSYLGGVIVAKRNRPVKLKITNKLPGRHILPVDPTTVDPAMSAETGGRVDRLAVHLHGGLVHWTSDGGPFAWFSNPHNGGFAKGSSFLNGVAGEPGAAVYDYPNQQSARMIWYHDHAYGITRLNAYAGVATAYLITDDAETQLIDTGVLPNIPGYPLGIPLVIQDKTFFDGQDHNYPISSAKVGDLWYPYNYEIDSNPPPSMAIPPVPGGFGRWDSQGGSPPGVSCVPEFFADTMLVNGAPYPVLPVTPQRFRFRLLNGSQARFFNLQLYVADSSKDGITLKKSADTDNNGNPVMVPTNAPGPKIIQIGTEGGFLPLPVVHNDPPQPIGYFKSSATGDPRDGNVNRYGLLMAPAERPDILIDFRGFEGQKIILYNDAPAPFPGGDIRNDYYPGGPNLTSIGGAPTPTPGNGPDTRVIMRFEVSNTGSIKELSFNETLAALTAALPITYLTTQPPTPFTREDAKVKTLNEDFDSYGRLRQRLGSPDVSDYLTTPMDIASKGETQIWKIYNLTGDTHPMHFHLVNVQVLERAAWAHDSQGNPHLPLRTIPGTARPADPNERGWRETVRMNPGEAVTVIMKFDLPPGTVPDSPRLKASYGIKGAEYVWHCHILEHEEHDMMHALVVV